MEGRFSEVRKGAWTAEEDSLLRKCIEKYGEGKWHQVPLRAGLNRCRKSCRLRWLNYLKPSIKRGGFSVDEVDLIIRLHKLLGNRWSLIAGRLPGRTANDVKNYWNTHLSKKQKSCKIKTGEKKITFPANPAGKIEVIKPRPRSFYKNSCLRLKDQPEITFPGDVNENNNVIRSNNNTDNNNDNDNVYGTNNNVSISMRDDTLYKSDFPASEIGKTTWWESLLLEESEEMKQKTALEQANAEEVAAAGAAADEGQSSWMNSALSTFDVDLWNLFNAENKSLN